MQKKIELKPCPFCGGEAKIKRVPMRRDAGSTLVYALCTACGSICHKFRESAVDDYSEKAAEAWNRRV